MGNKAMVRYFKQEDYIRIKASLHCRNYVKNNLINP
jgi:hypothetical protein